MSNIISLTEIYWRKGYHPKVFTKFFKEELYKKRKYEYSNVELENIIADIL